MCGEKSKKKVTSPHTEQIGHIRDQRAAFEKTHNESTVQHGQLLDPRLIQDVPSLFPCSICLVGSVGRLPLILYRWWNVPTLFGIPEVHLYQMSLQWYVAIIESCTSMKQRQVVHHKHVAFHDRKRDAIFHCYELYSVCCFALSICWLSKGLVALALPASDWVTGESEKDRDFITSRSLEETAMSWWL